MAFGSDDIRQIAEIAAQVVEARQVLGDVVPVGAADVGRSHRAIPQSGSVLDYIEAPLGNAKPRGRLPVPLSLTDARRAINLTIIVESTLDQPIEVQIYGTHRLDADTEIMFPIGEPESIDKRDQASFIIDLQSFYPYYGVEVTPLNVPTTGQVSATAHSQQWLPPERG